MIEVDQGIIAIEITVLVQSLMMQDTKKESHHLNHQMIREVKKEKMMIIKSEKVVAEEMMKVKVGDIIIQEVAQQIAIEKEETITTEEMTEIEITTEDHPKIGTKTETIEINMMKAEGGEMMVIAQLGTGKTKRMIIEEETAETGIGVTKDQQKPLKRERTIRKQ